VSYIPAVPSLARGAGSSGGGGCAETLIVSDVHLGLPASRPGDLLRLLEARPFGRLILLGDIFHDFAFRHLCADAWRLLRHLREVAARGEAEVVWVSGNHDRHLAPLVGGLLGIEARESFSWTQGGRACHAVHGDRFDAFVSGFGRLSDALSRLYAISMRHLSRRGEWPRRLDRLHVGLTALGEEVAEGARLFAAANPFDVIVCGHTHEAQRRVFEGVSGPGGSGVEYVNSGAWLGRPASFLTADARGAFAINRCP
jgi:UDP-2,3-diacylglucosamine pyrophosphatase LpxH